MTEEYIQIEEIKEEEDEETPVIGIAYSDNGGYRLQSVYKNPLVIANILTGLANSILERHLDGRNAGTHRFFGR